jgi:hypothetical protein
MKSEYDVQYGKVCEGTWYRTGTGTGTVCVHGTGRVAGMAASTVDCEESKVFSLLKSDKKREAAPPKIPVLGGTGIRYRYPQTCNL